MPEFLLSVHHDYSRPLVDAHTDPQTRYNAVANLNKDIQEAGAWVFAGGLEDPGAATVVAVEAGEVRFTDGPRTHGGTQLGGFWVIDVPDMESAVTWAQRAAIASGNAVEVRPFQA